MNIFVKLGEVSTPSFEASTHLLQFSTQGSCRIIIKWSSVPMKLNSVPEAIKLNPIIFKPEYIGFWYLGADLDNIWSMI
jgi:hypothetical protein